MRAGRHLTRNGARLPWKHGRFLEACLLLPAPSMLGEARPPLELVKLPDRRVRWLLPEAGGVVVGRAADAFVVLDDPSVSPHHAALHRLPQLQLIDLGSRFGTRVGGALIP